MKMLAGQQHLEPSKTADFLNTFPSKEKEAKNICKHASHPSLL